MVEGFLGTEVALDVAVGDGEVVRYPRTPAQHRRVAAHQEEAAKVNVVLDRTAHVALRPVRQLRLQPTNQSVGR